MVARLMAVSAALLLLIAPGKAAPAADTITVLAAASLTDAMTEIGRQYQSQNGKIVRFSYAGSMVLAKQIEATAGADLFISADEESMDYVDGKGLLAKTTRVNLLANTLVLIAPSNANTTLMIGNRFPLANALMGGRLAVADTQTVPAGRYAKAALMALDVWDSVANRLAQGEDVRATLAYVARGESPVGIVYGTDARVEPRVRVVATFPENTHPPILYPAALTKDAKRDAAAFLAYLKDGAAKTVFEKNGFTVLSGR